MSVLFDASSVVHSGTIINPSWTHTPVGVPTGVGVGVAFVATNGATIVSVSYGGVPCTLTKTINADFARTISLYSATNPPSGPQTVQVNFSVAPSHDSEGLAVSVTGGNTTQVFSSPVVSAAANSTQPTVTVVSSVSEFVMDLFIATSQTAANPDVGQTQRMNQLLVSGETAGSTKPGAASVSMTWNLGGGVDWAIIAASFKAPGGAVGGGFKAAWASGVNTFIG